MVDRTFAEALLGKLLRARVAGDLDAIGDLFTDDVTFEVVGFAPIIVGKAEALASVRELNDEFRFKEWQPLKVLVDGADVAARCFLKVQHKSSDDIAEMETSDYVTIREGKIASYTQFVDTALAMKISNRM